MAWRLTYDGRTRIGARSGGAGQGRGSANPDLAFDRYLLRKYAPDGAIEWERLYYEYGGSVVRAMELDCDAPVISAALTKRDRP